MSDKQQRRHLTSEELASIPPAVDPAPTRPGAVGELGAPRPDQSLEDIVSRAERMRDVAVQDEEAEVGWHEAEHVAAIYSQALQHQEVAERIRRTQRDAPQRNEEGERVPGPKVPRVPRMVVPRAVMWDQTTIRDPETGAALVKPGNVGRWVRVDEVTPMGAVRRSAARLHNFLAWGAEVVRDSSGRIVQSIYGVAVQGPPETFAARSAKSAPTGTLNRKDLLAPVQGAIDEYNRKFGEPVARISEEKDHGAKKGVDGVDTYASRK